MNILRNFVALIKGMPDWHEKYNQDMSYLYDEVNGAKSDGIINTYTHSKTGTSHTLTGAGAIMRFTARAPWIAGDTVTVNGTRLNPLNLEGKPLPAGAFVAGMQVVAIQDGQNLQFLTQSYADQFANINSQMENKANLGAPAEYDLSLAEGITPATVPKYWRDGNNVGIRGTFKFDEPPIPSQVIATLPEGYRPKNASNFLLSMAPAPHTSIYGWIFTDGVINLTPADLSEDVKNSRVFAFIVPPFCVAQ